MYNLQSCATALYLFYGVIFMKLGIKLRAT
nr:MAG TPA: hypothetical protein [Caudoviricetes sp.]